MNYILPKCKSELVFSMNMRLEEEVRYFKHSLPCLIQYFLRKNIQILDFFFMKKHRLGCFLELLYMLINFIII